MTALAQRSSFDRDDLEWFLDHSRRRFLVRESRSSDWSRGRAGLLTIVRKRDGKRLVVTATCELSQEAPENTDVYAAFRWTLVNERRRQRGQEVW